MMTTDEKQATADNIIFLPQPSAGRQICSLSLFQDKLYAGLTWPASDSAPNKASILKCALDTTGCDEIIDSEPADQSATSNDSLWQTGCHAMAVFKAGSDSSPALYASMLTPSGCKLMMINDGEKINELPRIAEGVLVHSMIAFDDHLFVAAHDAQNGGAAIYFCEDPASGKWEKATEAGFGDAGNTSISSMAEFNDSLYVATLNPTSGFQLWCTSDEGDEPYAWQQVISQGALRYTLNQAVISMTVFDGALYLGTGSPDTNDEYAEAAELIRVYPDNSWDIVVGSPRFSPYGLKVPMAAMGPGFDNRDNIAITAMAAHEGRLYVTTCNTAHSNNLQSDNDYLWSSADGEEWSAVATGAPESMNSMTVRAIIATPKSLLLATAKSACTNSFAAVAMKSKSNNLVKQPSLLKIAKSFLGKYQ